MSAAGGLAMPRVSTTERLSQRNPRRLGEYLLETAQLRQDELDLALQEQRRQPRPLGEVLVAIGLLPEATVVQALGVALGVDTVDLSLTQPTNEALGLLPGHVARRHRALPLRVLTDPPQLLLAMAEPRNVLALDHLAASLACPMPLRPLLAGAAAVDIALARHYASADALGRALAAEPVANPTTAPMATASLSGEQLVALVDALLADAVQRSASDIHLEPEAGFLRLRLRVDGVLGTLRCLPATLQPGITVRLKVLAGVDIAESRLPQDGHFTQRVHGREVDVRLSTMPTRHGENLVLRLLDRRMGCVPLAALGLDDVQHDAMTQALQRRDGLLLVCGPTGAGKTTTLYSLLHELGSDAVNVMTLEDPIEYALPGIRQSAVNAGARLGFADGVRALLRQDPDILLIGEIRDEATAAMALRAAMTGHLVLSTLHAGSALGALPRLLDLGLRPPLLAGALAALIAQRLLRRLDETSAEWRPATVGERRWLRAEEGAACEVRDVVAGAGKETHAGYAGRFPVLEILRWNADLDAALLAGETPAGLMQLARGDGFETLRDVMVRQVLHGRTSIAEAQRVFGGTAA